MATISEKIFNFLKQFEGLKTKPYLDTENKFTVGIGVNIADVTKNLNAYLVTLGIAEWTNDKKSDIQSKTLYNTNGDIDQTATDTLKSGLYINTIKNAVKNNSTEVSLQIAINNVLTTIQNNINLSNYKSLFHSTCEITKDEAKDLFDLVISTYTAKADGALVNNGLNINKNSNAYIALTSLAFNNPVLLGPGLKHAIRYGNRAEAWYQIRYVSNADVVQAKRRYAESELFGWHNGSTPTDKEAKDFVRMYRLHKTTIDSYEKTYSSKIKAANDDLKAAGFNEKADTLANELKTAKDYLIKKFANGVTIDGEVIVGIDSINDDSTSGNRGKSNIDDTLTGTSKNDLIFGEKGDDTIITGKGNDTIYTNANIDTKYDNEDNNTINTVIAGQGSDTIYGSKGKDIVYGDDQENEGNNWSFTDDDDIIKTYGGDDRVYGGNDSDIIEGGSGNDTLYGGDDDDEIYAYYKQNSTDKEGTDENTINILYGEEGDDKLYGDKGKDYLYGGDDTDMLYGGDGDDYLDGGKGTVDYLEGGKGFDTYIANSGDIIKDEDGKGNDVMYTAGTIYNKTFQTNYNINNLKHMH